MLYQNGIIHTMAGAVLQHGYFREKNGMIEEVGAMPPLQQEGEESFDLQGAHVYPGLIDAHTHLGMWEDGLAFEGDDGNEETDPVTPQLRAIDAINPMDRCFEEALEAGVTTVITGPGSTNPIGGQLAAIKTTGFCIDEMIVKAPVAMKMALGENPKVAYHDKSQMPYTRMATAALIREQLFKAKRYWEELTKAQEEEDCDPPEYDMKCEALLPVLKRELKVHFHAHRSDDIYTAIRLGREFNLDFVIVHGTEAYLSAEYLAEQGVSILSGPSICDRSKPELKNLTPASTGILSKAGVPVAVITDHPVIPIQYLPVCAALVVREGMDRQAALEAITCGPAKICGIDDRVGSLEAGKDADFIVYKSQDPLCFEAKPDMVFVKGRRVK